MGRTVMGHVVYGRPYCWAQGLVMEDCDGAGYGSSRHIHSEDKV